jgi:hypothetical protein
VYSVASDRRLTLVPDIPTFGETGLPAVSFSIWYGLFAPKGTPRNIIDKINAAAVQALAVVTRLPSALLRGYPMSARSPSVWASSAARSCGAMALGGFYSRY